VLELKIGDRNRCTLTFDNLRVSKTRKALVFYLRDLGLPLAAAKHVVRKALYAKGTGVRVYRLTSRFFAYVEFDEGLFFVGTEEQLINKVRERYSWQQGLLWITMAEHASRGTRMSRIEIADFIYDTQTEDESIELITKNVAPIERRRPKRRRRRRRKVRKVLNRIYWYDDL
jgi:hypothetical protein